MDQAAVKLLALLFSAWLAWTLVKSHNALKSSIKTGNATAPNVFLYIYPILIGVSVFMSVANFARLVGLLE